ncbi:ABC transporter permease [Spiroplasma corruscae]|uniref:ABC transporter permease n=1 Tax=Spiroplasma corruscae TaxID=216934 RepID=A0A222ER85_9MOLU|nr:ABC transporter permease [Spiroplasma corruscae]ASP28714.1 ABC transporter permease [Spiroplasma corruscae]
MLLFKNGIKQLFKDWLQFIIYLTLISIGVIFTSAFGVVSSNLVRTNNNVSKNFQGYDYSYKYTSSSYSSNDTQTISPLFAFSNDYVSYDKISFPTITIGGEDSVLLSFNFSGTVNKDGKSSYSSYIYYFQDDSSDNLLLNFGFGDTEGYKKDDNVKTYSYTPLSSESVFNYTEDKKIDIVKSKAFGRFYRFNEKSKAFQSSMIGQVYKKNNDFKDEVLNASQKKAALDIYNYMFYLNNSSFTASIKNFLLNNIIKDNLNDEKLADKVNQFVNYSNNSSEQGYNSIEDFKKNGYKGRIGNLYKSSEGVYKYFIIDDESTSINNNYNSISNKLWDSNNIKNYGSYLLKNYESEALFKTGNSPTQYFLDKNTFLRAKDLFNSYYDILSDLTNFNITYTNEVVMWDSKGKYRFISAFTDYTDDNTKQHGYKFNNDNLYTVYEGNDKSESYFTKRSFMTTYGYYKNNSLQLGKEYSVIPQGSFNAGEDSAAQSKLKLDAVGVDALNIYPTIYDEDILANQVNDAIFYINTQLFKDFFNSSESDEDSKISNNKFQDVSKAYLKHNGDNKSMEYDINLFRLYAADNVINLKEVSQQINNFSSTNSGLNSDYDYSLLTRLNPKAFKDTKVFNMRSGFFGQASKVFLLISFIFCVILLSVILFITYNLTKKFLTSQRGQIGNLKALGVRKTKIIINFILYLSLPIIIMVPIGWGLSIALEKPLLNIFGIYFNIPIVTIIDWKFLLVEWLIFAILAIFLIWFISYRTVKKNPLILMQPSKGNKPNLSLTKFFNKLSFTKFTNKIRGSLIALSLKDLIIFSFVIFVSTMILTISASIPNALSTMSKEYYNAINYNNDYSYTDIVTNNPFTKYNWRETNGDNAKFNNENSLFSSYMKNTDGKYLNLFSNEGWSKNASDYSNFFESIIKYKALGLNGYLLSTGNMKQIIDTSLQVSKNNKGPSTQIKNIACSILPSLFNQPPIEGAEYDECVKSMTNNIIPTTIKQRWENDVNSFLNFSFNFNIISYNQNEDEIYTNIKATDEKHNDLKIYGLNEYTKVKNINLTDRSVLYTNNDDINVSINETLKLKGYNVGDKINLKFDVQNLGYVNNNNEVADDNNFVWQYDGEDIDVNELDLGHFASYPVEDSNKPTNTLYYLENGEYKQYKDINKISLKIKDVSILNQTLLNDTNNDYKEVSGNELKPSSGEFKFNPFDIRHYENGKPQDINISDLISGTNSWWNIALEKGLFKTNLVQKSFQGNIVKVEKVYDSPKIYMDQVKLNKIIGFRKYDSSVKFNDNKSVNIWSNAKMSSNPEPTDKYDRAIVKFKNWNNTTNNANKYMSDAIGFTDYISLKKLATSNLITSVASISVVFITISMIVGIIIIYVITDLFVGKYKSFMNYMRVQGYSIKEINSIIIWIFLPLTFIFSLLAIGTTMGLLLGLVPKMLLSLEIAIPLMIEWYVYVSIFFVSVAIFSTAYLIIIKSLFRVKLASLTGAAN